LRGDDVLGAPDCVEVATDDGLRAVAGRDAVGIDARAADERIIVRAADQGFVAGLAL
jgi:hypothetical protein